MPAATDPTTPEVAAWDDTLLRDPHAVSDKRRRVQQMFAAIAPSYDLNNRLHSLWMDQVWRWRAVNLAGLKPRDVVVDVACGTGDLAFRFANRLWYLTSFGGRTIPNAGSVIAIDFTFEMLPIARSKGHHLPPWRKWRIERGDGKPLEINNTILWVNGDAQSLPLPDACCDVVSIAFGIRNVQDPAKALREFRRVLRPGGRLIILEFSLPTNPLLRGLYNFYFRKILPRTATLVSGDKTGAYRYLPESVNTFIGRQQMTRMMREAGFSDVTRHPMTFGVCVGYRGFIRGTGPAGVASSTPADHPSG